MSIANVKELSYINHLNQSSDQQNYSSVASTSSVNSADLSHISGPSTSDYLFEESGRGCRTKRKQIDPLTCPVCSVTVRPSELETHYLSELTKLDKLSSNGKRKSMSIANPMNTTTTSSASPSSTTPVPAAVPSGSTSETEQIAPEKCWETYQTVKSNRQSRLKLKTRKRKPDEAVLCPVCNQTISGDINYHVDECLRKNGECHSSDEDIDVDVDGDDFSEYEWAGQHRVRASSMLEGGYSAVGIGTRIRNDLEEEDLVVDGDDSDKYGPAQYTERDIMLVSKGEDKDQTTLRLAIIGDDTDNLLNKNDVAINQESSTNNNEDESTDTSCVSNDQSNVTQNPTIEALKQRVRELEKCESNKSQYKCLICMGRYRTPVISICCWHVHCELCWLKTLGIKKLCPQCNMITSPTDLRKVYI